MADSTNPISMPPANNDGATPAPTTECPICTSNIGEARDDGSVEAGITLPCTHFFGLRCLAHSILDRGTCPVCRADIPRDIVHDLARIQRGLGGNATGDAPSQHSGRDWQTLDAEEAARDAASFFRNRNRGGTSEDDDDDEDRNPPFHRSGGGYGGQRSPSPERVWRSRGDTSRHYGGAHILERFVGRDGRVGTRDVTYGSDDEDDYRPYASPTRREPARRPSAPSPRSQGFPSPVEDVFRERARRFREREREQEDEPRRDSGRYEPRYVPETAPAPAPRTPRVEERFPNPLPWRHVQPRSPYSPGRRNALPSPVSQPRTSPPRRESTRPGQYRTARGTVIEEREPTRFEERSVREQNEIVEARRRYQRERRDEEERRRRDGGGGGRGGRYDYWG